MKSWIDAFTAAVVIADERRIEKLISTMPEFDTKEQRLQASALIQEALRLMESEKAKTLETMQKIKKTRTFLVGHKKTLHYEYRG